MQQAQQELDADCQELEALADLSVEDAGEAAFTAAKNATSRAQTLSRKPRLVISGWTKLPMLVLRVLAMAHAAAGGLAQAAGFANDMQQLINEMAEGEIDIRFEQRDWSLDRQKCAFASLFRRPDDDGLYPDFRHMATLLAQRDAGARNIKGRIIGFAIMGAIEGVAGHQDRSESWLEDARQSIDASTWLDLVSEIRLKLLVEASSMGRAMRVSDNDSERFVTALGLFDTLIDLILQSALDTGVCRAVVLFCYNYRSSLHYKQSNHTLGQPDFAEQSSASAMQALEHGGISPNSRIYKQCLWEMSRAQHCWSEMKEGQQAVAILDLASHGYQEAEGAPDDYDNLYPLASDILRTIDATTYTMARFTDSRLFFDAFQCRWRGITRSEFALPDFCHRFENRAWALILQYKTASIYKSIVRSELRKEIEDIPLHVGHLLEDRPEQCRTLAREEYLIRSLQMAHCRLRGPGWERELAAVRGRLASSPLLNAVRQLRQLLDSMDSTLWQTVDIMNGRKRVVLIDWVIRGSTIFIFSRAPLAIYHQDLRIRVDQVAAWITTNLNTRVFSNANAAHEKLKDLTEPVAPLAYWTEPSDTLVLCPTGVLSELPLHALSVDGRLLLERNPVIYTTHHGLLVHQVRIHRADSETEKFSSGLNSAVFTVHRNHPGRLDRFGNEMATTLRAAKYRTPKDTVQHFQTCAANKNLIFFHGYSLAATRPVDQALILGHGSFVQSRCPEGETPERHVNVKRVWGETNYLKHPLLLNIISENGDPYIKIAPQPLALSTTSILAGAHAVVSPLWQTQTFAARTFCRLLINEMKQRVRSMGPPFSVPGEIPLIDLAVAVQQAVLKMRQSKTTTPAPYHWAPWILCGNWEYRYGAGQVFYPSVAVHSRLVPKG